MTSLVNQFLIAMPELDGTYFGRSIIYLCEHDDEGAMGLVINKPTDLSIATILDEINLEQEVETDLTDKLVISGGPVQTDRGFILHNGTKQWSSSLKLDEQIIVTTSKDILSNLNPITGPDKFLMTLGYSGWSAGQLEDELANNTWLTLEADPEILFNTPADKCWDEALKSLGISPEQLTAFAGHA